MKGFMADPASPEIPRASPEKAPLAQQLLDALKTRIDAPANEQPAYHAMLNELQRSTDKSNILRNVRTLVEKLQPQERAIVNENLVALEKRLQMTSEFEDLQQEIGELKAAVGGAAKQAATESGTWFPQSADPSEWTGKQIATVSALTIGLAGLFAWWKSRKKQEKPLTTADGNAAQQKKRSSFWYWLPGIGLGVVGLVYAHSKLMQFDAYAEKYRKLADKTESLFVKGKETDRNIREKAPAIGQTIGERKDAAVDAFDEGKEVIQQRVQLNAFIFEHKQELGALDENDKVALSSFMNDAGIQNLYLNDFATSNPKDLLKRTPNSSDEEMFEDLKSIVQADNGRHETMGELFGDTFMGGITARVKEAIGETSVNGIQASKIAQAALGGVDQLHTLASKPNVREGLKAAGIPQERSVRFIEKILVHGSEHIDAGMQHFPEFRDTLLRMKQAVQQPEAITLIAKFGHNKGKANEILAQQIIHNGATHLTLRDTVELYMCLQLMKGEKNVLPENLKEGNPSGTYLLQMKALDLLSRSQGGEEASKGVKMFLLFRGFDASIGLGTEINLPPEVLEQLQEVTQSLAAIICKSIIDKGLWLTDSIIEAEIEAWTSHHAYYGLVPAAHVALIAEIKNMYDGLYLKRLARIRDLEEGYRFGIYSQPALDAIKQNAQNYKSIQKLFSRAALKRIPGVSQVVTSGFVQYDRYQKLLGWADADTEQLLVAFMRGGYYPHLKASVIDQIRILAENARARTGAAIANEGRSVGVIQRGFLRLRRERLPVGQKVMNMLRDLEQINVPLVDQTHKVIQKLSVNEMPTSSELRALGLSQQRIDEMLEVFHEAGIGARTMRGSTAATAAGARANALGSDVEKALDDADDVSKPARAAENVEETFAATKGADVMSGIDDSRWAKVLAKHSNGADVRDVRAFLELAEKERLIDLDAELVSLINESPRAQKIIAGAIQTTDVHEVTRALNAAKLARSLRIGLNGLGAVGDMFGITMAYADYQANGARIENAMGTKNQALIELYQNANYIYTVEGVQSVAGLAIGGVAFVKAAVGGESFLSALGSSGGLIMLPVAAAVIGGGYVYRKAEGVAETWLRTSKDWQRAMSPGELLEKLKEIGPGQRGEFQGWGKGTVAEQLMRLKVASETGQWSSYARWEQEGEQRIESANQDTRGEITRAYVVRTSLLAKNSTETDAQYEERFARYVMDQMEYLGRVSGGSFAYMVGGTYEKARIYAELQEKSRVLKAQNKSELIQSLNTNGETQKFDIKDFEELQWKTDSGSPDKQSALSRYISARKEQKLLQFALMQRLQTGLSPEQKKQIVAQDLILACQDDLLRLDGRIAVADFSGTLGKEVSGEAVARYTAMKLFQESLTEQTNRLLVAASSQEGVTRDAHDSALLALQSVLGKADVLEYQQIGIQRRYVTEGYVVDPIATKDVLSAQHMLQSIAESKEPVEYLRKSIENLSDEKLDRMRKELGEQLLIRKGATEKNGYYQVQFGYIFNKYLYMRFNRGVWKVSLGSSTGPWSDPEQFRVSGLRNSLTGVDAEVSGKYNEIVRGLADVNKGFRKENVPGIRLAPSKDEPTPGGQTMAQTAL